MSSAIIPKRIVEEIEKRGLDIEELLYRALKELLSLDPGEIARARVEIAEKSLEEARGFMAKGDVVQASEKLYKAVEECIKALAEAVDVPQLETARRRGKWETWLLGQAATDLSKKLGEERILYAWSRAYEIHVWGFHEVKYRVEDVEAALPVIEWLLNYTKKFIEDIMSRE